MQGNADGEEDHDDDQVLRGDGRIRQGVGDLFEGGRDSDNDNLQALSAEIELNTVGRSSASVVESVHLPLSRASIGLPRVQEIVENLDDQKKVEASQAPHDSAGMRLGDTPIVSLQSADEQEGLWIAVIRNQRIRV